MEFEHKILTFSNTPAGQQEKVEVLNHFSARGWKVVSEVINQSNVDPVSAGRDAACLCFMCGPFCTPFLMNKDKYIAQSVISVTLERSIERRNEEQLLQKTKQETIDRERYERELEANANIESVLDLAKKDLKYFYPDNKVIKAIQLFLTEDRMPLGPIPSYAKSRRQGDHVILADSSGAIIAEYDLN